MDSPSSVTHATVVTGTDDGELVVVRDDGIRMTVPARGLGGLRRVHPGQRVVIDGDGTVGIGSSTGARQAPGDGR